MNEAQILGGTFEWLVRFLFREYVRVLVFYAVSKIRKGYLLLGRPILLGSASALESL